MHRQREDPLAIGRVIGDVVDPFVRTTSLSVVYGSKDVTSGCELKPSHVVNQPRVDVAGGDLRTFYTLVRKLFLY
jgi:protein FLOWERING LOCUS T